MLKDGARLVEVDFPVSGLTSVFGDGEGCEEMSRSAQWIAEFLRGFSQEYKAIRLFFPDEGEAATQQGAPASAPWFARREEAIRSTSGFGGPRLPGTVRCPVPRSCQGEAGIGRLRTTDGGGTENIHLFGKYLGPCPQRRRPRNGLENCPNTKLQSEDPPSSFRSACSSTPPHWSLVV